MTPYDAAMAGVIVAGMIWGALRGITWQLAGILSLVVGYSAAQPLSVYVAPYLPGEPVVARALAMIVVYFGASGGIYLVAWMIRATLRSLQFEAFDKHLGMLLGGLEGAILGLVVTLFVVSLAPQTRTSIFASPTGRCVATIMTAVGPILPSEARQVLGPFLAANNEPEAVAEAAPRAADADPAPRVARASARGGNLEPSPPTAIRSSTTKDAATRPASFSDLLEESERRIGQAVIQGASEGLRRATQGGNSNGRDRAIERR